MTPRRLAGSKQWVERYEVIGSKGDPWIVAKRQDGCWGCSCPAWKFHKAPKPNCKHIRALIAAMAAVVNVDFFSVGRKFREMGDYAEAARPLASSEVNYLATAISETVRTESDGEFFTIGRKFRLE